MGFARPMPQRDHLQGYDTAQTLLPCPVNYSLASSSNFFDELVITEIRSHRALGGAVAVKFGWRIEAGFQQTGCTSISPGKYFRATFFARFVGHSGSPFNLFFAKLVRREERQ